MHGENLELPDEETIIELPVEDVGHEGMEPLLVQDVPTSALTEAIDQTQISLTQREITRIAELQPEVWSRLDDPQDRVEALQRLENRMAETVGRDHMKVVATELPGSAVGKTDWEERTILIDERVLDDRDESVRTLVHEARHGYQMDAIENPWKDDRHRVEAWADNSSHYFRPEINEEAYRKQALEQDAYRFENRVLGRPELGEGPMFELPLDVTAIDEEKLDG